MKNLMEQIAASLSLALMMESLMVISPSQTQAKEACLSNQSSSGCVQIKETLDDTV